MHDSRDERREQAAWDGLRTQIFTGLNTPLVHEAFVDLRSMGPNVAREADVATLVERLVAVTDNDDKDVLYRELVRAARGKGAGADLAMRLLWVGLWPGLDAVHRRSSQRYRGASCAAEIARLFIEKVGTIDVDRIRCVAASIIWNTERDLYRQLRREAGIAGEEPEEPLYEPPNPSELGLPSDLADDEQIEGVARWLDRVVGADADLVLRSLVLGEPCARVGRDLGVGEETARKRLQRALQRARDWIARTPRRQRPEIHRSETPPVQVPRRGRPRKSIRPASPPRRRLAR